MKGLMPFFCGMCYSNSSTSSNEELGKRFNREVPKDLPELVYYHNSGFQFAPWRVITSDRCIQIMNWGLVPYWFQGIKTEIAKNTLNCKVETITEKPSFRHLVNQYRCIIPSTGFYEWQQVGKEKIPHFIYHPQGKIMSFAGLWDQHIVKNTGEVYNSFSIITTQANEFMAEIHNVKKRMPLIIDDQFSFEDWLDSKVSPIEIVSHRHLIPLKAHRIDKNKFFQEQTNVPQIQELFIPKNEQISMFD